ncbi:MAG TPA: metallophosphoesterase [Candidatus Woesearchaeota archaeon]|nr:metallophosphoesterase [Candidatus Woesearchaeota archaeon]
MKGVNIEDNYRSICFVSDLHISGFRALDEIPIINEFKALLRALISKGDCELVILGDFLELLKTEFNLRIESDLFYLELLNLLKELSLKTNVTYILGNHDKNVIHRKEILSILKKYCINIPKNPFEYEKNLIIKEKNIVVFGEHGNQYDPLSSYNDIYDSEELGLGDYYIKNAIGNIVSKRQKSWINDVDKINPISSVPSFIASNFFYKETSRLFKLITIPFTFNLLFAKIIPLLLIYLFFFQGLKLSEQSLVVFSVVALLILIDFSFFIYGGVVFIFRKDFKKFMAKFGFWDKFKVLRAIEDKKFSLEEQMIKGNIKSFGNKVDFYFYGHTHLAKMDGYYNNSFCVNTGQFSKGYALVKSKIGLPAIYVPYSFCSYAFFRIIEDKNIYKAQIKLVTKKKPIKTKLTWFQRISIIESIRVLRKLTENKIEIKEILI